MYSKLVHHFLEDSARNFPQKPALFSKGAWHTFLELDQQADAIAAFLREIGVNRGDRVGILIENSMEYVATYYAILKIGAITVAINTEVTAHDVQYLIRDCGIDVIVTNLVLLNRNKELLKKGAAAKLLVWSPKGKINIPKDDEVDIFFLPHELKGADTKPPRVRMIDLDIASIVYTSGSTGKPRGVVLSHLNIVTNTRSIVDYLHLTENDRIMVVLPFYYIYGKSLLNTHFFVGGSVVIDNRFMYPNVVLNTMQEQEVTGFSGVPSTFSILLNRSNVRALSFPTLRYVTQAGGAMAPALQKEVAEVFAPARLYIMYGATEASARLSYLEPDDLPRKWGSIGKAIPNVELFVADSHGRPLPVGEQGEIVARGANIMQGYWNHPEETAKVLKKGLYFTGDLGVMDEEGFIFVVGRKKDMIKIGGNRVSAKEIEEAIFEHPDVAETAVIAAPDDVLGEVPKAFIVLKNNKDPEAVKESLQDFLKDKIAVYKIPKYFEIRESLPKSKSGKIQKLKLK